MLPPPDWLRCEVPECRGSIDSATGTKHTPWKNWRGGRGGRSSGNGGRARVLTPFILTTAPQRHLRDCLAQKNDEGFAGTIQNLIDDAMFVCRFRGLVLEWLGFRSCQDFVTRSRSSKHGGHGDAFLSIVLVIDWGFHAACIYIYVPGGNKLTPNPMMMRNILRKT